MRIRECGNGDATGRAQVDGAPMTGGVRCDSPDATVGGNGQSAWAAEGAGDTGTRHLEAKLRERKRARVIVMIARARGTHCAVTA